MTLSDDQIGALLRDVPLPSEPLDRYGAVAGRRRARDRRWQSALGAAMAAVLVAGAVSVVTLRRDHQDEDVATLLSGSPSSARVAATIDIDGRVLRSEGVVDFAHDASSIVTYDGGHSSETRQIGRDVWSQLGSGFPGLPAGKTWVHVRTTGNVTALDKLDPNTALRALRDSGAKVERRGRATVRGVPTDRYVATRVGDDLTSVDVFVDADGLARRVVSRFTPQGGGTGPGQTTVTAEYFDFGVPVSVTTPPASTVAEQSELSSAFSSGTAGKGCTTTKATPPSSGYVTSCMDSFSVDVGSGPSSPQDREVFCNAIRDSLSKLPADKRAEVQQRFATVCPKG